MHLIENIYFFVYKEFEHDTAYLCKLFLVILSL